MKRVQESAAAKACAWIVLLAAAFAAGVFGVRALFSFIAVNADSWQASHQYNSAQEDRRQELVNEICVTQQLDRLRAQIGDGDADASLYADIEALQESREATEIRFSRRNTWFRFRLLDANTGDVLGSNLNEGESMLKAVRNTRRYTFTLDETFLDDHGYYSYRGDYGTSYETSTSPEETDADLAEAQPLKLVLEYGVPETVDDSIQDEFYMIWRTWEDDRASFDDHLTVFLSLAALMLIAFVWILWTAGHRSGVEGIVTTWQERVFFDLYAIVMVGLGTACMFGAIWAAEQTYWHSTRQFYWTVRGNGSLEIYSTLGILGAAALCAGAAAAGSLLLRTFAVRIKAGCLAQTTLLCRVCGWTVRTVHDFVRALSVTWKVVSAFGVYILFTFWLMVKGVYDGFFLLIYWGIQLIIVFFLAWWTYGYHRLRKGTKTIVKGDLEYQIDTRRMPYDLRLQAEDLNNISAGLSTAVDEKMRSERFKAELITNVSHDLKTPLTSIINYVNLLKNTDQTDPKAVEYIEVLDRKSQRLKKLTEDLVEASKASTGVLAVTREKIGMSQLIDQALGEWEEKLSARRLTLVTTLPEGETWVYADGRHLWRVVDNLLSNCAKYAMEGTRIYLDLDRGHGQVALSVKNISRDPLNIPAERLMERFVRGEESRSTEGSGLGLSIARSLTELQGGTFDLAVDGDLFKAVVTLPQAT